MAQFDICRNSGRARDGFPYFVIVQSSAFETTTRRLVIPLTRQISGYPEITPAFIVEGERVVADTLLMFAIPRERLGPAVGTLADDADATAIIAAIDRVINRARG